MPRINPKFQIPRGTDKAAQPHMTRFSSSFFFLGQQKFVLRPMLKEQMLAEVMETDSDAGENPAVQDVASYVMTGAQETHRSGTSIAGCEREKAYRDNRSRDANNTYNIHAHDLIVEFR